ncbi:hypothetical protein LCGC14_2127640 [marine sediment metagenome]|uniref:Uncharacterized protein n=1 Tax=marine sediment metagenome TaxID=412755 RepID=A0A0F9E2D2_9ZZZZ
MKNKEEFIFIQGLVVGMVVVAILSVCTGCNETQKIPESSAKPLNQHLVPLPDDWKDAYGNSLETEVIYNLVLQRNETTISRNNEILIANMISKMHPSDVNDPNNLMARIERLEASRLCKFTEAEEETLEIALRALVDSNESKKLKTLEEHNIEVAEAEAVAIAKSIKERLNGIACPECGSEMYELGWGYISEKGSNAQIACSKCEYRGERND